MKEGGNRMDCASELMKLNAGTEGTIEVLESYGDQSCFEDPWF